MRFLHTADWQIGMTRHYLRGEAQARFTAARIDAIRSIGDLAQQQGCEFIVVCGDVFETNQLSRQTIGRALEALAAVPVPVYLLPGNHDPLEPVTIYRSPQFVRDCPPHVHVLTSSDPVTVREGVELISAPWSGKHPDTDLVGAAVSSALAGPRMPSLGQPVPDVCAQGPGSDLVRIVVGHGAVDVLDPDRANPASIALAPLERALADGHIHYVALGDRHSRTSVGDSGAVWYSGAPEVTDFREHFPGDVLVVDLGPGAAPVVTPHHVGRWVYRTVHREINNATDVAALARDLAEQPDKDRTVLRLALRGALGVTDRAALAELLEEQGDVFACLSLWERHTSLRTHADGSELAELGLGGFLGAAAEEMHQQAQGEPIPAGDQALDLAELTEDDDPLAWEFSAEAPPDAQSATDALALLYRFSQEVAR